MPSDKGFVRKRSRGKIMGAGLLVLASFALGACQTTAISDSIVTGSNDSASLKSTAAAAKAWESDPSNINTGLNYAKQLKALGQTDKALSVLGEMSKRHPENSNLVAIYGKELAEAGRAEQAAEMLHRLVQGGGGDWKIYSALGSAYDQMGQFKEARQAYQTALQSRPREASVLNNLALSYALEGNLPEAERTLKQAIADSKGGGQARLRQNLALVVGLQGRFEEAKEIAAKDLPPVQVEANMSYLRNMLAQPDSWQQLKGASAKSPDPA